MSLLWRFERKALKWFRQRRCLHTIGENDLVMVRSLSRPDESYHLSKPLESGKVVHTARGTILHEQIIGKEWRTLVEAGQANGAKNTYKYMLCKPTLEEYIVNRRREAQPIYPLDASLIVELADIAADYPEMVDAGDSLQPMSLESYLRETGRSDKLPVMLPKQLEGKGQLDRHIATQQHSAFNSLGCVGKRITKQRPLQYLECGTGHGSLTLYIAKALHAANAFYDGKDDRTRGAILHSLDRNEKHLKVGMENVKQFRKGLYWADVEFHLESNGPNGWLESPAAEYYGGRLGRSDNRGFLDGAFLDLPSPEDHLAKLSDCMAINAPIIVFTPSIMQIWDCVERVKAEGLRLSLITVYELTAGSGGGGMRQWDLRRSLIKETGKSGMVVRPKVGARVVGGGFVAVFRRVPRK
ncbi:ADR347Cp [Eremothecium gossypii ATCC 10895]|uniref:tRNA (adenine(58)-N(1))-methyltransferase catalytic subunit TRM61 n=1 Tax=Eremothecium gossypii (strain ATCC 10895 / CBS 109.51 / FGSC 9923 / NRRL Y-1056) TaxID=284811 RepID=Q759D0_EREGS|nr:ADR347Cp [Eremothecium gossypii ATCC 10895]AAS52267.2 ADR347Cp [Eremothecium gossypii ATCC 10895]AEY96565.1 FADR347Cp [Eremothecium gossypii FDAG1]